MLVQGFLLGTQRHKFISMIGLFVILAALFLAFSRGAWISFLVSSTMIVAVLTFILTPSCGHAKPDYSDHPIWGHWPRGLARSAAFGRRRTGPVS